MRQRNGNSLDPSLFTAAPLPVAVLDDPERLACLRLIRSGNVGPVTFRELINQFGGAQRALDALPDLTRRAGGPAHRICPRADAERELAAAGKDRCQADLHDRTGLSSRAGRNRRAATTASTSRATKSCCRQPTVAIVGSRQASAAGHKLARQFAAELGRAGFVIASGLARGIDGAAHEAALLTGTVAVVAGGIDIIYPPEHAELTQRIAEKGCIISEMPPGFVPRAKEFPRRNRIIAGVSLGVLVVEAARRSGTLVTARLAAELGREVFAIPGHPLDPRAEGTNQLLKSGAVFVTEAADLIAALQPMIEQPVDRALAHERDPLPAPFDEPSLSHSDRQRVLSALGPHPSDVDEIGRVAGLSARAVRLVLVELDLAGRIERHGQHLVSLLPPSGRLD